MMDEITMMQVPGNYWLEAIPEIQHIPAWFYPLAFQAEEIWSSSSQVLVSIGLRRGEE
jgi:hypothetical protein